MPKEDSVKRIQVSNNMLTNKTIKHEAIYLYIILKSICKNNQVNIYAAKLLKILNWKDIRTLRKYLLILYELQYIDIRYDKMPKHKSLEFNLINNPKKNYVQVDIDTIGKIISVSQAVPLHIKEDTVILNLQEMAVRLFYIYEMYYNVHQGKAFPEYKDITNNTGISSKHITALNKVFEENKIVKIKHGDWYEIEDLGESVLRRKGRNEYRPKCNRAENKTREKDNSAWAEK